MILHHNQYFSASRMRNKVRSQKAHQNKFQYSTVQEKVKFANNLLKIKLNTKISKFNQSKMKMNKI